MLVCAVVMFINSRAKFYLGFFQKPDREPSQVLVFAGVGYGNSSLVQIIWLFTTRRSQFPVSSAGRVHSDSWGLYDLGLPREPDPERSNFNFASLRTRPRSAGTRHQLASHL